MSRPLCSVRGLVVEYPQSQTALAGVDLDIMPGEKLAVIGESGSGKSTLAFALAGLLPPGTCLSGQIDWPTLQRRPLAGCDFGVVFQDPGASLNPVMTIGEQVAEGAQRHLGLSWKQAFAEALHLLERVQIPQPQAAMRAYPHQFSGGQRQRIAIAAAMAARPKLLIADEATSALDLITQAEIVALLDDLVQHTGMGLLFITHDIALASSLADRIAVFHQGRLVEQGPAGVVLGKPLSPHTLRLRDAYIDLTTPALIATGSA